MRKSAKKNIIYSILLLLVVFMVYLYRQNKETVASPASDNPKMVFSGQTMGTTYRVVYLDPGGRNLKKDIDSILVNFNQALSTYISDSELSRLNKYDSLVYESMYFYPVLKASKEVFTATGGAFDPTIGPLVNAWGFGPGGPALQDSLGVKQLMERVGFEKISFDDKEVKKSTTDVYLDFSAIAKGYGVDVIAEFLKDKGIVNYLVEIGGELKGNGVNDKGELWKVGVSHPDEEGLANEIYSIVALENKGLATSGNYRNFYIKDSVKYSHTISPFTGYPVVHRLLSATVVADDCITADAYATAFMVLGMDRAKEIQQSVEGLEIFLIFNDDQGQMQSYVSDGLAPFLTSVSAEEPK
ncbi:FAD:protein FMN transferase [Cyclobacterium amurskyense]|uniref:FAD:protein FMN transferase n=1 Tax=Cyclobacterium amurskyense TaxID=320787 RepID=A0A0H4PT31_9BACT|nr:FAD:protein FMN transferase [Cyclobacterium amurskyense]AKP51472.1 Thiamin biosynthesis lipoprotein ApbE [Cyclobacterium amurskyense]|tara:strand:+ start:10927 stop:11994 length:1068 start_codon:yes stop_codon:yes gene_type:complete